MRCNLFFFSPDNEKNKTGLCNRQGRGIIPVKSHHQSFHIMKKILLFLLIISQTGLAQTTKTVKARVDKVTVFNRGAQIFATEKVSLPVGTTDLVFENVSFVLLQQSLQASASGDVVVMDVRYNLKYTITEKKPDDPALKKFQRDLKFVQDSLVEIGFNIKGLQTHMNNFATERTVLLGNRLMRGELQRDSLVVFQQSIDYLRQRLNNIDVELLKLEREKYKWEVLREGLLQRQGTLQTLITGNFAPPAAEAQPIPQVIVTVLSERAANADITINYYVEEAGWVPTYDLRATNSTTDIELNHRAGVYQNSGIEWKDVLLTLSTGNPNESNVKPVLPPFVLQYEQQLAYFNNKVAKDDLRKPQRATAKTDDVQESASEEPAIDIDGVFDYTTVTENLIRIEYAINLKYTIASDGQSHNVVIQNRKIPAQYNYAVVPKLDPDVFLMARLTDWEDLNLVPGTARVYFDGSYVGQTAINPGSTNDTLLLNLGRDKSIVVKRIKLKDKSKEKVLNENRIVTKTFEITIRNTKSIPIRLIVEDQMPISKDPSIKITYEEYGKASFNPDTGKLIWDFKLDPKESKKMNFTYEVKYPKDRLLANL